jgi:tryptophanyl-tRNA synthetase
MARVFSGIKPTGHPALGNHLGAVRRWAEEEQHRADRAIGLLPPA